MLDVVNKRVHIRHQFQTHLIFALAKNWQKLNEFETDV